MRTGIAQSACVDSAARPSLPEVLLAQYKDTSIIASSLWMIGISLLLFFLPALNGLIGGAVGGYKAGSTGRALSAAVLPAVVVGMALWGLIALFDAPVIGFVSGIAVGLWALFSSLGVLLGALIGGAVAPSRRAIVR
jgi:hypothetical protein